MAILRFAEPQRELADLYAEVYAEDAETQAWTEAVLRDRDHEAYGEVLMDPTKLPSTILNKHPELKSIGEALAAHREGRPVTATCPICEGPLHVEEIKAVGSIWVLCPNGCTRAHFKVEPEALQKL